MSDVTHPIFTIGHSTHSEERFLELLRIHRIEALGDVRSSPFSRFNPQFSQDFLRHSLKQRGLRYVFLGRELGARSEDRSCYVEGRIHYSLLAQTALFRSGIDRIIKGSKRFRIALMCAEREPLECHRALLVAQALVQKFIPVFHIHADGHLESHQEAMNRLIDLTKIQRGDLFRSHSDLLAEAIARQEENVAYVDENLAPKVASEELP